MKTKKKAFDCVEMKNRIQKKLLDEYESRKGEFSSYGEFINATADESETIRAWRKQMAEEKARDPARKEA